MARCSASGVFQGFHSVSGTVHAVVKRVLPRWAWVCSAAGLPERHGRFYVKSQIQVVFFFIFPPLVKHPVLSREDRGRLLEAIILSACHRHGMATVLSAGPRRKVSLWLTKRFNSTKLGRRFARVCKRSNSGGGHRSHCDVDAGFIPLSEQEDPVSRH